MDFAIYSSVLCVRDEHMTFIVSVHKCKKSIENIVNILVHKMK